MEEFILYIIKNLVDQPDAVQVNVADENESTLVKVQVSEGDVGKLVGRKGRTINALRTIAMIVGARLGRRVRLEIAQ